MISNTVARTLTNLLKSLATLFFRERYGHRAVVLETVAAVPGMVAAFFCHLESLRTGSITTTPEIQQMLDEAANERMHLMIILQVVQPTFFERLLILFAQLVFTVAYSLLYLLSRRTAHKMISLFEKEAVKSYTKYINLVKSGQIADVAAPQIAIDYYKLDPETNTFVDVLFKIRTDEQRHEKENLNITQVLDQ